MKKIKGFTIIELLLGLSIFSIIIVLVYSVFFNGLKLEKRANQNQAVYHELRMTLGSMEREFENMSAYDFEGSYEDKNVFEGAKNSIQFLLAFEDGLKVIRYFLQNRDQSPLYRTVIGETYSKNVDTVIQQNQFQSRYVLIRQEQDFKDFLSGTDKDMEEEIMLTNLKQDGLTFSYGRIKDESVSYQEKWDEEGIPSSIKIRVSVFNTDEKEETIFEKAVLIPTGALGDDESEDDE